MIQIQFDTHAQGHAAGQGTRIGLHGVQGVCVAEVADPERQPGRQEQPPQPVLRALGRQEDSGDGCGRTRPHVDDVAEAPPGGVRREDRMPIDEQDDQGARVQGFTSGTAHRFCSGPGRIPPASVRGGPCIPEPGG